MNKESTKFVIQWHLTHKCNLRCKHCYQEEYEKDLDFKELIYIFSQIKTFFNKNNYKGHINFTGGEPLLCEHLWGLTSFCDNNGITYGILTNGTMINDRIIRNLKSCKNLSFIQISLDGSREIHDSIRGKGSFDKAVSGLKELKRAGIETMVSFTASNTNFGELKAVIRLCQKIGVDRFWTDRLVPMGNNSLDIMTNTMFKHYISILRKEIKRNELLRRLKLSKTYIHNNRAMQFMCNCDRYRNDRRDSMYKCSAGKRLLAILADGKLLPCRRLPIELGNLTNESLSEIIENSVVLSKIINDIDTCEDCNNCIFKDKCNSGAKCLTFAVKGEISGKDINCLMK